MRVSAGNAFGYATMPGIFPRLRDILFSGFGPVTQLIAVICFMAGILPKTHPCFAKDNREKYGLTRILAAAADNIKFEWKHIDQVIVFALIVCGTVMIWLYLAGLVFYILTNPALATSMFVTANPDNDVAFMMLDKVLGIPGLYNSAISAVAPFPTPFHTALHELFRFYSMGIFFIALTIFLYHVIHFILDVTQTGHVSEHLSDDIGDGGRGFSWLPIRFVVCFGLLIPFGMGLNSAQWITLYVAKFGSGLATNAWIEYNTNAGNNPTGEVNKSLITRPAPLGNSGLIKSLFLMRACQSMNAWGGAVGGKNVELYVVNGSNNKPLFTVGTTTGFMDLPDGTNPYNAKPSTIADGDMADNFIEIWKFSGARDIQIVSGEYRSDDPLKYKKYPGKVLPVCGSVVIPVTGMTGEAMFAAEGYFFASLNVLYGVNRPGSTTSSEEKQMFAALIREYVRTSDSYKRWMANFASTPALLASVTATSCGDKGVVGDCKDSVPSAYWNTMMDKKYSYAFGAPSYSAYDFLADTDTAKTFDPDEIYIFNIATSFSALGKDNPMDITTGITDRGWGGAGLWYNKITERNGSLYNAVMAVPSVKLLPMAMEDIKKTLEQTDKKISGGYCEKFRPSKSGAGSVDAPDQSNSFRAEEAKALFLLCTQIFENDALYAEGITRNTKSTNPIEQAISSIYSEFQLHNKDANTEVNPMAQMSSLGRMLIEKSIVGVVASSGAYAVAGASYASATEASTRIDVGTVLTSVAGDIVMTIAMLGLTSGFVLHYMVPLMPFMYFFFAVGRWVKVIFEALVGVPLWALAHMRVGGPGLPGSAAIGGYFLLLEIFIRPILTVFSLIAAFSIFSALTIGLNSVFSLISQNLFGSAMPTTGGMTAMATEMTRGMVDQFFLTTFYVAIVYVIATGSFKLIDLIPDNIMRWSGAGVQSMGAADVSDDLVDQWQWELPTRFSGAAEEIKGGLRDVLLGKNEAGYENKQASIKAQKQRDAASEKVREQRRLESGSERNKQQEQAIGGGTE